MYRTKIFDEYSVEDKLAEFLNENKISRDQIVSISMIENSVDRILLVWEDDTIYKTQKEKEDEMEQLFREREFQKKQQEEAWAQLQKSLKELQSLT